MSASVSEGRPGDDLAISPKVQCNYVLLAKRKIRKQILFLHYEMDASATRLSFPEVVHQLAYMIFIFHFLFLFLYFNNHTSLWFDPLFFYILEEMFFVLLYLYFFLLQIPHFSLPVFFFKFFTITFYQKCILHCYIFFVSKITSLVCHIGLFFNKVLHYYPIPSFIPLRFKKK